MMEFIAERKMLLHILSGGKFVNDKTPRFFGLGEMMGMISNVFNHLLEGKFNVQIAQNRGVLRVGVVTRDDSLYSNLLVHAPQEMDLSFAKFNSIDQFEEAGDDMRPVLVFDIDSVGDVGTAVDLLLTFRAKNKDINVVIVSRKFSYDYSGEYRKAICDYSVRINGGLSGIFESLNAIRGHLNMLPSQG